MSSAVGSKWFIILLSYFVVMVFIIGLISQVSSVDIETTSDSYTGCGLPRNIYIAYTPYPIDVSDLGYTQTKFLNGQFECERSIGILSQSICEDINGCSWAQPLNWIQILFGMTAEESCTGLMNYAGVTDSSRYYAGGLIIDQHANGEDICTHPDVMFNETKCDIFSCTWKQYGGVGDLNIDNVQPSLGLVSSTWNTVKDMFTFRFSFGFEDTSVNNLLNFLIFWLPLLALILSIYVMVRS